MSGPTIRDMAVTVGEREQMQATADLRLAGLIAGAVALAVLWVVSLLAPDAPFAPSAVAEAVIRLIPGDLATFFIEMLGHWARRLLTVGAVAAALLVAVHVLVRTAGDDGPRTALAGALLAVAAAIGSFVSPTQDANPALVVLSVTGAALAYAVTARYAHDALRRADRGPDEGRRRVIRMGVGAVVGIAGGGAVLGWLARRMGGPNTDVDLVTPQVKATIPARDDFPDIPGLSQEITSAADHYVVDINLVQPTVEVEGWTLKVSGEVDRPLELTFSELQQRFEVVEEYSVLCCVSNEVGGDLIGNSAWGGVRLAEVLEAVGVRPGAADVVFSAADGYSDSIPLEAATSPSVLLAVSQNGRPLTREHGFPCRIRIPSIYGMKNVKWVESIEVVAGDYKGYWQQRGWSDIAAVRTQSRVDVAGDGFSAESGEATWVAGVAWAGDRSISRVEVTTDGGRTWSRSMLQEPVAPAAWTRWAYRWTPAGAGEFEVACRATDGEGNTQTDDVADPHPAGATGYHRVMVRVS
jgi:DMSO/TMAO reductase YedYZ molybdopterin-dependent catalytic subunit